MKKQIDLHMHTTMSDGEYAPYELINMVEKSNTKIMSITDHDTIEAYRKYPNIFKYAEDEGVELVPGIEISTKDNSGNKYHIVGLFIDIKNDNFYNSIKKLQERRIEYVKKSYDLFLNIGYIFDINKILKEEVVTKAHIADYIIENDKNKKQLIIDFGCIPTRGALIEKFMLKDQKCFVEQKTLTPEGAIKMIKEASGVAIFAHPTFNVLNGEDFDKMTKKFIDWGIDGFEAYNIQYKIKDGVKVSEFELIEKFENFCLENNLLISGGSDFHTDSLKIGKTIQLGDKRISIPEEYFLKIKELAEKRVK